MPVHSEQLLDHFQNPRNVGSLEPPALTIEVSNPACGDILKLYVLVQDGTVSDVRYRVRGCTAAIASGSALTEWLRGRSLQDLRTVSTADIENAVGGLEPASKHAAVLCVDGVRALVHKLAQ